MLIVKTRPTPIWDLALKTDKMKNQLFALLASFVFFAVVTADVKDNDAKANPFLNSPCGDWVPFKEEKCVKLVPVSDMQTREEAEITCKAYGEELHTNDVPKLVMVKSEEKQKFLENLLFKQYKVIENVWLGLNRGKDGIFRWDDEMDLIFSNWLKDSERVKYYKIENDDVQEAMSKAGSVDEHNCVYMLSGDLKKEDLGKWVPSYCTKRSTIVCERDQPWSVTKLQNSLLSLNLKVEKERETLSEANEKIKHLENNPVPVGFIYVQIPHQTSPSTIWPKVEWEDISSTYAGLFFRVLGGDSAKFGDLQYDQSNSLNRVEMAVLKKGDTDYDNTGTNVPNDGSWSKSIASGGYDGNWCQLSFRRGAGEVRPKNKAVKVWKRVK